MIGEWGCRNFSFCTLLIFGCVLSWTLRCGVAADSNATSSTRRRLHEEGMGDGHVEGCFDRFDVIIEIPLTASLIGLYNNRRCQAACGLQAYSLAATRSKPLRCMCGNDYPSAFHQVMLRPESVIFNDYYPIFTLKLTYFIP